MSVAVGPGCWSPPISTAPLAAARAAAAAALGFASDSGRRARARSDRRQPDGLASGWQRWRRRRDPRPARRPEAGGDAVAGAAVQVVLALARPESLAVGPALVGWRRRRQPARRWLLPALAAVGAARSRSPGWRCSAGRCQHLRQGGADWGARPAPAARPALAARSDPTRAWAWSIAAAALLWALAVPRRPARRPETTEPPALAVAAALTLAPPALALLEGGDYFTGARPLVVALPFEAALALVLVRRALGRRCARGGHFGRRPGAGRRGGVGACRRRALGRLGRTPTMPSTSTPRARASPRPPP
jgi:hypothetical protein